MIEVMWKLGEGRVVEVARMRGVLRGLERVPGFQPARYDLNQHGNWRAWSVELAAVDALNEKVQIVSVEGAGGPDAGGIALVAMVGGSRPWRAGRPAGCRPR